jgi:hypothetical protein
MFKLWLMNSQLHVPGSISGIFFILKIYLKYTKESMYSSKTKDFCSTCTVYSTCTKEGRAQHCYSKTGYTIKISTQICLYIIFNLISPQLWIYCLIINNFMQCYNFAFLFNNPLNNLITGKVFVTFGTQL